MFRKTWMEINLDRIENNIRRLKEICGKKVIAVLKANAYGCGDRQVLQAVAEGGADMVAVSSLDEALIIRNEGYPGNILILGSSDPEDVPVMIEQGISAAAYSMQWVQAVTAADCRGLKIHMKVDTGMNRIGFKDNDELKEAFALLREKGCVPEGIFTHFFCADTDRELTQKQFERFSSAVKTLDYPFEWIHCDNSDATVFFRDTLSNACRVGISLYGISTYEKSLKYPISLYTELSMVKKVYKGETIGYGATFTADEDMWIGTMPIGYADGLIRANQGRKVYVDGSLCEITGRVCMDQTMIRLPGPVPVGTRVEIFGPHINIEDMADELHTIPYEIFCLISPRVTREYIRDGKVSEEENIRMAHTGTAF